MRDTHTIEARLAGTRPRADEEFRVSLRKRLLAQHAELVRAQNVGTFSLKTLQEFVNIYTMQQIKRIAIGIPAVAFIAVLAVVVVMPQIQIAQAKEIARQDPQIQALLSEGAQIADVAIENGTAEVTLSPAYFIKAEIGEGTATLTAHTVEHGNGVVWVEEESAVMHGVEASDFVTLNPTDFVRVRVDLEQNTVVNMYTVPAVGMEGIELVSETENERVYKLPNGKTIKVQMLNSSTGGDNNMTATFKIEEVE